MIDLLGTDFEEAEEILKAKGLIWTVSVSEPPNKKINNGCLKVIKQEIQEGSYRLTLCKVPDDYR